MAQLSLEQLTPILESAYRAYHNDTRKKLDPVHIVHEFSNPLDKEAVGFLSALLAYGNVQTIVQSIRKVLRVLGPDPSAFLRSDNKIEGSLAHFKHRFTIGVDMETLLYRLRRIYQTYPTLEDFYLDTQVNLNRKARIVDFVRRFHAVPLSSSLKKAAEKRGKQLRYLLSNPEDGSACKRLNLFLRWMVRPHDGVDLGIWKRIHPAELFLPLDTHLMKTLRLLRWTRSESATWKVVEQATANLLQISPTDPTRYDFSLCHLSMNKGLLIPLTKPIRKPT